MCLRVLRDALLQARGLWLEQIINTCYVTQILREKWHATYVKVIISIVARCVTVPRRASSNASRSDIGKMRYCASPSCNELASSINRSPVHECAAAAVSWRSLPEVPRLEQAGWQAEHRPVRRSRLVERQCNGVTWYKAEHEDTRVRSEGSQSHITHTLLVLS